MLSGKLPTGTVDDPPGGAGRDEGLARPERPERASAADRRGRTANAADADLASENRRLKRRLAAERAERQAVIDRYERLLADRTGTDDRTCQGDGAAERAVARLRRALTRLRCWCVRSRSRRE